MPPSKWKWIVVGPTPSALASLRRLNSLAPTLSISLAAAATIAGLVRPARVPEELASAAIEEGVRPVFSIFLTDRQSHVYGGERVINAARLGLEVEPRQRIAADREPDLGQMRLAHIAGRGGSAHLGRDPAGLERIRQDVAPPPRDREGDEHVAKLALGIGRRAVPGALRPKEIVHSRLNAVVHAGAQIDEPVGPFDQGGEDIGRENVDCENAGDARLRLDASRLAIADPRIVDHGVEAAEPIDLFGDALRAGDGREIA